MKGCCSNQEKTFSAIFSEIRENYPQLEVLLWILVFVIFVIVVKNFLSVNDDKILKIGTKHKPKTE